MQIIFGNTSETEKDKKESGKEKYLRDREDKNEWKRKRGMDRQKKMGD